MKQLRHLLVGTAFVLSGGMLLGACSSEEDEVRISDGKGLVKIGLTTDAGFQTKAVTESDYTNKDNYTIQILKNGTLVSGMEWNYTEIPSDGLIELTNGAYVLKAFYGEEYNVAATRDGLYMVGEKIFNVNGDQQDLNVTCKPVQAKIVVVFDEKMDDYFSDYSVSFQTKELGSVSKAFWEKDDKDPLYLKVDEKGEAVVVNFSLTKKDGAAAKIDARSYTLKPLDMKTITIAPVLVTGDLGITIEVDKGTNDVPVDVIVPADWF